MLQNVLVVGRNWAENLMRSFAIKSVNTVYAVAQQLGQGAGE